MSCPGSRECLSYKSASDNPKLASENQNYHQKFRKKKMSTVSLPIQIALLALTLTLQTATGVTTEYAWRVSRWNTSLFLTMVEGFKMIVSSVFHVKERRATSQPTLFSFLSWSLLWDTRHYAVPSLLYMIGTFAVHDFNVNLTLFS